MSVALCKFVCISHKMFSEYSSARNFKGIVQKYYTNFLPSTVHLISLGMVYILYSRAEISWIQVKFFYEIF